MPAERCWAFHVGGLPVSHLGSSEFRVNLVECLLHYLISRIVIRTSYAILVRLTLRTAPEKPWIGTGERE